jgi:hypothetical protein
LHPIPTSQRGYSQGQGLAKASELNGTYHVVENCFFIFPEATGRRENQEAIPNQLTLSSLACGCGMQQKTNAAPPLIRVALLLFLIFLNTL